MKHLRRLALVVAAAAPLSAFAHPGHEGDHDFSWDFEHLVEHPLATIFCFGLLAAGAYLAWRFATRPSASRRVVRK